MRRSVLTTVTVACLALGPLVAVAAGPPTIKTVAGNGQKGAGADGAVATATPFDHPRGLSVVASGGFLVAEPFQHVVVRVRADGRAIRVAGTGAVGYSGDGGPATAARLFGVHGVAPMPDGGFVLADSGNHRIRRVWPDGTITTVAGTGVEGFSGDGGPATAARIAAPRGVATRPDGSILIPDTGNHRVRRVSPRGIISTVAGTGVAGRSGDGRRARLARLDLPFDVAPLVGGGLLIADAGSSRIRRVDRAGVIRTVASNLASPHAVAALPDGGFLVANTMANHVLRFSAAGAKTTIAGTGRRGYSGDGGPAKRAKLSLPKALAVLEDRSGFLVGDSANNRVRLVKLDLRPR